MAMAIGSQFTACEQCASICPSGAIRHGFRRHWIDPLLFIERLLLAQRARIARYAAPMEAIAPASVRPRSPAVCGSPFPSLPLRQRARVHTEI